MSEYTIFMDESGNTGSNYLDFTQPIFTFSGIGIEHQKMASLEKETLRLKSKHRIPQNTEIHAKNLFKRQKERAIRDFLELLMYHEFMLFFSIVEKKFAIATFIDSEFFDPIHNDKCDNTWTHPSPKMNERSNFFYDHVSEEAILACGKAFRSGDGMRQAYELVRRDIKGKQYEIDLYDILGGVEAHLEEIAELISSLCSSDIEIGVPMGSVNTPNFICFSELTQKIDDFYSCVETNSIRLVFDASNEYNNIFKFIVERLISSGKHITIFSSGSMRTLGFNCIERFDCEDSKNNIFLQLSDLVATSIRNVIQKVCFDSGIYQYSELESLILHMIYSHKEEFENTFCNLLISDCLGAKIVRTIFDKKRNPILKNTACRP